VVKYVRASIGSLAMLGIIPARLEVAPTALYLMLCGPGRCAANCAFCAQARTSSARSDALSRVIWPKVKLEEVLRAAPKARGLKRVCLQTLIYPGYLREACEVVSSAKRCLKLPVSVAVHPLEPRDLEELKEAGADSVGIGLDAASEEVFEEVKGRKAGGPFSWKSALRTVEKAVEVFGPGNVTCHLVYGLGDSDEEFLRTVLALVSMGARVSLFAFTPIKGTRMERRRPPSLRKYRAVQLATYLAQRGELSGSDLTFVNGELSKISAPRSAVERAIFSCRPFVVQGCDGCNRPFYNEPPRGPYYNYPSLDFARRDLENIRKQLRSFLV